MSDENPTPTDADREVASTISCVERHTWRDDADKSSDEALHEAVARVLAARNAAWRQAVKALGDRIEHHLDRAEGCDYGAGDMIRAFAEEFQP